MFKKLIILPILTYFCVGCATTKVKQTTLPSVETAQVVTSLENTKNELQQAGDANTKVATSIDKALSLAERLQILLDQIEKEQQSQASKTVLPPIK